MSRRTSVMDPYAGNILTKELRPIKDAKRALEALISTPMFPEGIESAPTEIRVHHLMKIRELHVPSQIELRLWTTLDLMVRNSYLGRDPQLNTTWADLSGEIPLLRPPESPSLAAAVGGPSGTGKSQGVHRCLSGCFGHQIITHASFPGLHGPVVQLVWLSVEVPASGKATDLALALMEASKRATGTNRFDEWFTKERIKQPLRALAEWHQWAVSHFLGCLHLDEVQNFFRLQSLKQRLKRTGATGEPELSVQEDQALKWFLSIANRGQYAVIVSGTNDGINALGRRFSTLGRLTSMGFHAFEPFRGPDDPEFIDYFLPALIKCQLTSTKLEQSVDLAELVYSLTAGVQRIIVTLWFAAHRLALERKKNNFRLEDFRDASRTLLAPLAPAIVALRSREPNRLRQYEDLVSAVDPSVWVAM